MKIVEAPANNLKSILDMTDEWVVRVHSYLMELGQRHGIADMPQTDEAALMARGSSEQIANFATWHVGQEGVEYFNRAADDVVTRPFDSKYSVQYDFFRFGNGSRDYRLEMMRMRSGYSPVHQQYRGSNGVPTIDEKTLMPLVHVSFKCPSELMYRTWCAVLRQEGATMGQECRSTYGLFSYWRVPVWEEMVWVKPRVNLRDGGAGE